MVCRKSLLNIRNFCSKRCQFRRMYDERKNSSTGAYFIFIPEVPKDTRATNPIMRYDEHPKFAKLSSEQVVRGCAKLCQELESKFDRLMEELAHDPRELSFDELFNYIEQYLAPVQYAENQATLLTLADIKKFPKQTLDRINKQMNRTKNDRYVHEEFHEVLEKLNAKRDTLTDYQRRLLDMNLLECRMAGVGLNKDNLKTLLTAVNVLLKQERELTYKVENHKSLFKLTLEQDQWESVRQLPRQVQLSIANDKIHPEKGPWNVSLLKYVYESFLEECPRRDHRSKVWNARHTVGTVMTTDIRFHTHELVDEIRESRKDIATILGYEHYADLSLDTKMAKDVKTVLTMLDTYRTHFLPEARTELKELHQFAESKGFREPLKQWDIPYYRRLQAKQKFRIDKVDRLGYFTFEKVLNTLLNLCEELFQIKFERVLNDDGEVWHPDVMAFDVLNTDGSYVSRFYLDPFTRRETKVRTTTTELGRERSDLMGMTPISCMLLSLNRYHMQGVPTLVSYQEVLTIFQLFGNSLQQMLTTVPYSELSGQRNVEWDTIHVCGNVMKLFAKQPWVIKSMSEHYLSGEELTDAEIGRLLKCQKNLSAFDMCNELYKSAFDIECHLAHREKYWKEIQEEVYKLFMPIELHIDDWLWCSDLTLWLGKTHAAGYYQYIWSEMLAANIFEEFESSMDNKNHLAKVGKRFRDTYLSLGGAVPAKLVFRQFMGRDPSFSSLITRHTAEKEKNKKKSLPIQE